MLIVMKRIAAAGAALVYAVCLTGASPAPAQRGPDAPTATPIKHLVVVFDENVSFDHYFATYPKAANPPGEPRFTATPLSGTVNNLASAHLLTNNPNRTNAANGAAATDPFRLDRTQAATASQNHAYTPEQLAYDGGRADLFPKYTGRGTPGGVGAFGSAGQVMGYYDGNTVTALWRYAQRYAMSDNAYTDTYGPSTPGALNVIAGQTNGMQIAATTKKPATAGGSSYYVDDGQGGYTMINDVDPTFDSCSDVNDIAMMTGRNIGDLLNDAGITWGGFMGGFNLDAKNANGTTGCKRSTHSDVVRQDVPDYIPHHNWFAYYVSTANPSHARPSSVAAIGSSRAADGSADPANHNYDLSDFYDAVRAGHMPAVSYLKAPAYQDAHAGYSDPLDEQQFLVTLVNFLQRRPEWSSTAIVVAYDDSDGWYDHAFAKTTNASFDPQADQVDGPGKCGSGTAPLGVGGKPVNGRCGPGTRLPFLVISPWAKAGAIAHQEISLASVVRFVEDNWLHGKRIGGGSFDASAGSIAGLFDFAGKTRRPRLFLDPATGEPVPAASVADDGTTKR
ncbi:MAG TPA: alkaline phosphatase family protein [Candidatus Elarobacter sp.]|jgi:phospholipase C|nr:alkaline phosphatase family protein [Candidatus Elarobacter sp.]